MPIENPWVEIGNGMALRCENNGKGWDVVLRSNQTAESSYVLLKRSTHLEQIGDKLVWC